MLHVREIVPSRSTLRDFVRFPLSLYRDDPNYIIPSVEQQVRSLLGRHNAIITNGVQAFLMAYDGDQPVGRVLAGIDFRTAPRDGGRQGYISMFECIDSQQVADTLFKAAESFLKLNGIARMVGPHSTFLDDFGVGLLAEGFDSMPTFLTPYNPPYYARLFEDAGFERQNDYYSYGLPLDIFRDERYESVLRRAGKRFGYIVENVNVQHDLKRRAREFARVIAESTPGEWNALTPTSEVLYRELKRIKQVLWPEYTLMAYAGERPVGLLLAIPDFNPLLKGLKGHMFPVGTFRMMFHRSYIKRMRSAMLYVVPEYQSKGVEAMMITRALSAARASGIRQAEASMVNEHNLKLRLSVEKLGGKVDKIHRQYGKPI